jgi:hypothetical protein
MGPSAPWYKAKNDAPPTTWSAICYGETNAPPANISSIPGKLQQLAGSIRSLQQKIQLWVKQDQLYKEGKRSNPAVGDPDILKPQIDQKKSEIISLLNQVGNFNKARCRVDWFCPNCSDLVKGL